MTTSGNARSFATLQCWVGPSLTSPGTLSLASGPPSSAREPSREPRLAGVLLAARPGLVGRGPQAVAGRRPTGPPLPCSADHLKDCNSLGGGATSLEWRGYQRCFFQLSYYPCSEIVIIALYDLFIPAWTTSRSKSGSHSPLPLVFRTGGSEPLAEAAPPGFRGRTLRGGGG